jgi:hypothetical protein
MEFDLPTDFQGRQRETAPRIQRLSIKIFRSMKRVALLIAALAAPIICIKAQEAGIAASSFTAKDRIIVRWAPTDYSTWKQGLESGYMVERFTIAKGAFGDTSKLTPEKNWKLKPIPLSKIKEIAKTDDDFASLEGIMEGDSTKGMSRLEQINQQESRYGMALLLADFSTKMAEAQALTFTDSLLPKNVMVGYKISMIGSKAVKPAYMLLNPDEKSGLPRIPFNVVVDKGKVLLKWELSQLERHYVGYYIERGDTKKSFRRLNSTPFVKLDADEKQASNALVYSDTLATIGHTYFYRIVGLSPYGFEAVKSDTLMVMVEDPSIFQTTLHSGMPFNKMMELKWECPDSVARRVTLWELKKATDIYGHYSLVGTSTNPKTRSMADKAFTETAYYQLTGKSGQRTIVKAPIAKMMVVDTIPPAAPQGLAGVVSRKGRASFTWRVTEEGIKAYNIYRNYYESEKPVPVFSTKDTTFSEQLQPGLSTKVYYYVEAVDERFNKSPLSKALMLVIPDSIPPVPAVIRKVAKADGKLLVTLISSPSNDIDRYELCLTGDSLQVLQRFSRVLPKTATQRSEALLANKSLLLRTYDQSGNSSLSEAVDLSPFIDANAGKRLAKVELTHDKKMYLLTISNVMAGTRELKIYTSVDKGRYELTKAIPVLDSTPITYTITDADKAKSYRVMVVGALNVKPVNVEVK